MSEKSIKKILLATCFFICAVRVVPYYLYVSETKEASKNTPRKCSDNHVTEYSFSVWGWPMT